MNPAQGQLPGQGSGSGQGAQSPTQQPQQPPGVTQGQGGQSQNQGQNPNLNGSGYFQPAQIRALNILSDEEKNKYVAGLEGLWAKIKSSPTGSNEYKQASEKIWNFSKMLQNKISARQAQIRAHQQTMQQQQAQQAQQAQQPTQQPQQPQQPQQSQQPQQPQQTPQQSQQQRPQAQNQQPRQQPAPQQQAQQAQQQQQAQQPQPPRPQAAAQKPQNQNQGQQQAAQNAATPNQNQASGQQPQQANSQPGRMPENIMNHLRQLKIKGLPDFDNKPAAEQQKHINDLRTRYGRALMSVDLAKSRLRAIDATTQKRSQEGKPFTEEEMKRINEQKAQQQKIHYDASKWIEGFRKQHVISEGNNAQGTNQNAQAGNAGAAAPAAQQGAANRVSPPNQNAAAQQAQAQLQAQQRPQLANNGGQNQQAGQAGRGQAPNGQAPQTTNTGGPGRALSHQAAMSLANQRAATTANNAQAQAQQGGSQSQAAGTPTSAGGAPAASAQQPAPQQPQQQQQAQQPQQPPSQQQTPVQQQQQQPPPPQQGHPHAHPSQAQTQMHSKMPIPKVLPEKATGVPQPVQTGGGVKGSRPTMNQGTGTMGSSMHQPAIQKIPAYNNEAEGDHVLSKKKLDELVRQVCGGSSDGQEGNLLSPDVEENVLNMADSFVDNVLHAASRNAKERGSKMLEIRDIQLVLERTYNIRVPGYSSDELRTVRKVQPTTGWIAKMSAVQAAKVMPGKGE